MSDAQVLKNKQAKVKRAVISTLFVVGLMVVLLWSISPYGQFAINASSSVEGVFFYVDKTQRPRLGDMAAFYPPKGNLYPDEMWFGKYVAGVSGDRVVIEGRDFYINGRFIGRAKVNSSGGVFLEMSSPGTIPEGHYFMWTEHEDSYDSRYKDINWIHESRVFGRMYRIF